MTDMGFGCAQGTRWWLGITVSLLLFVGACSSDGTGAGSTEPEYNSFEEISAKLGCQSLISEEKMNSHVLENKVCVLPDLSQGGIGIFHFADAAQRDATMKALSVEGAASFLTLSDNWMLVGNTDDVVTARDKLGAGEIQTPEQGMSTASPSEESPADVVKVPPGESATYKGEQARLGKVHCGFTEATNKLSDSCRVTNLGKIVWNTEWGGKNDPEYKLPEYLDAKAPKGDEFYVVAFRWKNVGKKPISPSSFGTLVTATGSEYESEDEYQYTLTQNARGNENVEVGGTFNPGKGYRQILVYTLPKGTKVASINWGINDLGVPTYTFEVK